MLHSSTKYDGSLHYRFPTQVILETANLLVLYRSPQVEMRSYRGTLISDSHLLGFYYRDRYHNLGVMWNQDWTPRMHYVNIATPTKWDDHTMSFIDMDLDLFKRSHETRIILDDEDEFEEHKTKYAYPPDLIDSCLREVENVRAKMERREGPFSDTVFLWRPGTALPIGPDN